MPIWRMQCAFQADSALPRDQLTINPHFNDGGFASDPQTLCEDLAAALDTWADGSGQINVKAYDAQGTKPVYPAGDATVNPGGSSITGGPRETAVCLSYYSGRNVPRQRGRLYIPWSLIQIQGTLTSTRPNEITRNRVAQLVPVLADLGGVDVDWVVYSPTDDVARPVSNWWVDDEWDTVRSRGLRPTTRDQGTVSE
jgi:hypothetical protein